MRTLQRLSAAAAALAAGALIATSTAAPAQAAATKDKPIDITKVLVKDITVSAKNTMKVAGFGKRCINVPMSLKYTKYAGTNVKDWIGAVGLGSTTLTKARFAYAAPGMASSTTLFSTGASAFVCDMAGKVGYVVAGSMTTDGSKGFDNPTKVTGSFYLRQDAAAKLAAKRSGKTVTLTAKATYFNIKTGKTTAYSPKGATIQVKKGSKWVKVNKKVTFKKGTAVVKVSQKAKKSYRITFKATSTVVGKTSKAVAK